MDIIAGLQSKKNQEAYQLLQQLEIQSAQSNQLYAYFDDFIDLTGVRERVKISLL